jgi:hypothetical protein
VAALSVAAALRIYLLVQYHVIPDADQTILGLMARHVAQGERPIFYWGQPYTGSAEAYVTAALFSLFGQRDIVLHLVPLVASVIFVVLTLVLAWRLYGLGVAALCGLYLACAPALLVDWSLWAGSGYLEAMALGTAALLLTLPTPAMGGGRARLRLPAAFLLLGFAVWVQPIAGYYLIAVLVTLAGRIWAALRSPHRWPAGLALTCLCLAAFAAGMAPLLQFNLANHWTTLTFLTDRATHLDTLTVLSRALLWAGPVVLGLAPPTTDRTYFAQFLLDHWALYGFALFLVLACLARGMLIWRAAWSRLRSIASPTPARDLGLLVLLLVLLAGYLTSSWGAEQWSGSQPRYLLPIYATLPLIVRALLPRRPLPWHWAAAALVGVALAAGCLYVNSTAFSRDDLRPLARTLEAQGITAIYGDYWLVYPVIYDSDEHLAGAAVNDDLSKGLNRYSPYLRAAAASRHYAWVVQSGSARQRSVLTCLQRLRSHYAVFTWRDQTIYDHLSRQAFPWWNGGRCPTLSG